MMELLRLISFILFIGITIYAVVKIVSNKINIINILGLQLSYSRLKLFLFFSIVGLFGFGALLLLNIQFKYINILNYNEIHPILKQILPNYIQAAGEEILIRGLVLIGILFISSNKLLALVLSSFIFSFLHTFNSPLLGSISYFLAGIMYGLALLKFKTLYAPIGLHFSWNFFQSHFFGFHIAGESNSSLFQLNIIKDSVLYNGGKIGPEESFSGISLRICIIGGIFLLSHYWHSDKNSNFLKI